MELVDILRVLARHRLALLLGACCSILLGLAVQYRVTVSPFGLVERASTSSTAHVRVLLDAPEEPPTLDLDSGVADTAGLRAGLLADLMATNAVRERIARRSGIRMSELAVLSPASDAPTLRIPIAVAASDAARLTSEPYALSVAADASIPIVSFSAAAPDTAGARRVAAAAVASYEELVATRTTRRSRMSVQRLGQIRTSTTTSTLNPAVGAAVAVVIFALWAAGVVLLRGLRRAWRLAS